MQLVQTLLRGPTLAMNTLRVLRIQVHLDPQPPLAARGLFAVHVPPLLPTIVRPVVRIIEVVLVVLEDILPHTRLVAQVWIIVDRSSPILLEVVQLVLIPGVDLRLVLINRSFMRILEQVRILQK